MEQGQIKHTPSEQVRGGGAGDIKGMVMSLTMNIILSTKTVIQSGDYNQLIAWGGSIEAFDSFISIYYANDKEYQRLRRVYLAKIDHLFTTERASQSGRKKIFRVYNTWFGMICKRLARFKIYPPLPVSYAQDRGQMVEVGE
ncbi:hypothetical protein GOV13_02725 [Candidatus Pacearchaeota archaeon]|nr:hypothetical protein [Candidatus Pacearchaeota archaeon]